MEYAIILLDEKLLNKASQVEEILKLLRDKQLDGQISWLDERLAFLDGIVFAKLAGPKIRQALTEIQGVQSIQSDNERWIVDGKNQKES